jgi:uncharacterized repeat protein (TIGR03803 family)
MDPRTRYRAALAFAVLIGVSAGAAAQESVLYRFNGGRDSAVPVAGLIMDASGTLYDTTLDGGTGCSIRGCGTVFALTPPAAGAGRWAGALPCAGLIMDAHGVLYGTTMSGGGGCSLSSSSGCGTVFKVVP